jgi:hypothetical protein
VTIIQKDDATAMFHVDAELTGTTVRVSSLTFLLNMTYALVEILEGGGDARVELVDVVITLREGAATRQKSVIIVERGQGVLHMVGVTIKNVVLRAGTSGSGSAVCVEAGDECLSGCHFMNVWSTRNSDVSGEGGALYASISGMHTVEVTDACVFENCSVSTGGEANGGAVHVIVTEGCFLVLGNTSFKQCSANSAVNGNQKGRGCGDVFVCERKKEYFSECVSVSMCDCLCLYVCETYASSRYLYIY